MANEPREPDDWMADLRSPGFRVKFNVDAVTPAQLASLVILPGLTNTADLLVRSRAQRSGASTGGRETAKARRARAMETTAKLEAQAAKLISAGHSPREVAGILAARFDVTARTIRRHLAKAGCC